MKKEFIPYTLALELKSLGFDEPCFGRYYYKESYPMLNPRSKETELVFEFGQYLKQTEVTILAPTFSQAFRFFREKYNLDGSPYPYYTKWAYQVLTLDLTGKYHYYSTINSRTEFPDNFTTYEGTELACLKKLIEICKNEQ